MGERFDSDFRLALLKALCADPEFFRKAVDFLKPEMIVERPICFAYSAIVRCYERDGRLPDPEVLQMSALDDLRNPDIPEESKPSDNELDAYAMAIGMAVDGLSNKSTSQTSYMSGKLKEFLQMCYMATIPAEATQSQRLELYNRIYGQMQSYDQTESVNELTLDEALDRMTKTVDIRNRVGTGLASVDVPLNGGLSPGEIGLIIAASGVGKSCAMMNFACENVLRGNESLYITLELSQSVVLARFISMLTGIRASVISKGVSAEAREKWNEHERRRFMDLVSKDGPNRHLLESLRILEYTDRHVTPDTLKQDIIKWKEARIKAGVDESKLGFVAVDWLNNIDPSGIESVNLKTQNQASVMERIVEALRQMGKATETRVWTAQQAARAALNKETLTMQDGRDSSGTFNPVDIGIGLATKKEIGTDGMQVQKFSDAKTKAKTDPDRDMIVSVMKDRNSGATGACIKIYQGPSLRFFESKKECQRAELVSMGGSK